MVSTLTGDVLQIILALLDIPDFLRCQRVCQSWQRAARLDSTLRALCVRQGFLKRTETLAAIPTAELLGRSEDDRSNYMSFLRSSWTLHRSKAQGLPGMDQYLIGRETQGRPSRLSNVQAVSVCHPHDCFVTTLIAGGLAVTCRRTGALLFADTQVGSHSYLLHQGEWVAARSADEAQLRVSMVAIASATTLQV